METHTYSKPIKLVALDIDGTLLNSKLELTPRTERAIKAAIADGVQVVLATGKSRNAGLRLVETLGLKTPGIYLQGLSVHDPNGNVLHQQALEPAAARRVITYGEDRGFEFVAYSGPRIMIRRYNKEIVEGMTRYHEPEAEAVGSLQNLVGVIPINKLMAIGEARAITALRWQLQAQLNGSARLMQAGIPTMLEILPAGASKGAALKWLLKHMKIDPENAMAMGDAENDIEMLQNVGLGVAIGNASQQLKQVAKFTVGANDEDGVAEAIERFVLRRKIDDERPGSPHKMIETPTHVSGEQPAVEGTGAASATKDEAGQ